MLICFLRLHREECPKIRNFVSPLHAAPNNIYFARDERGQSRAGMTQSPIRAQNSLDIAGPQALSAIEIISNLV